MKQEVSPVVAVIVGIVVLLIVIGLGWKMFLAPKGSGSPPAGMTSGMGSPGLLPPGAAPRSGGMVSGGPLSGGMMSGGMRSGGAPAPGSGGY